VGTNVTIQGKVDLIDRRKLYTIARVLQPDGSLAVEAKALFIAIRQAESES
jgi:hypothetical protein